MAEKNTALNEQQDKELKVLEKIYDELRLIRDFLYSIYQK